LQNNSYGIRQQLVFLKRSPLLLEKTDISFKNINKKGEMYMYKIVRFYNKDGVSKKSRIIKDGVTLKEAQEHCQRSDTSGFHNNTHWFDGYTKE
tara:strand:+ start:1605 stop:1886 length:282 start_codon:yes stop_codon:yes gene_type:complete